MRSLKMQFDPRTEEAFLAMTISLEQNKAVLLVLVTGKQLIQLVRAGEQPTLYFADASRDVGAAQTQTCRYKLVVSVNTSSDLRVWGREQMTSYILQHDETEKHQPL